MSARTVRLCVLLSEAERAKLRELAKADGRTLGAWIRRAIAEASAKRKGRP